MVIQQGETKVADANCNKIRQTHGHLLMHLTADDERERSLKIKNLALPDDEMVYPGERF